MMILFCPQLSRLAVPLFPMDQCIKNIKIISRRTVKESEQLPSLRAVVVVGIKVPSDVCRASKLMGRTIGRSSYLLKT